MSNDHRTKIFGPPQALSSRLLAQAQSVFARAFCALSRGTWAIFMRGCLTPIRSYLLAVFIFFSSIASMATARAVNVMGQPLKVC